jgi:hypothetical protein
MGKITEEEGIKIRHMVANVYCIQANVDSGSNASWMFGNYSQRRCLLFLNPKIHQRHLASSTSDCQNILFPTVIIV